MPHNFIPTPSASTDKLLAIFSNINWDKVHKLNLTWKMWGDSETCLPFLTIEMK